MVQHLGTAPRCGDSLAHTRHASAGFTGNDDLLHAGMHSLPGRGFAEMKCVGRSAEQHPRTVLRDGPCTRRTREAAARNAKAPMFRRALKRCPESEERPE
jgi:hypothetical protein